MSGSTSEVIAIAVKATRAEHLAPVSKQNGLIAVQPATISDACDD